MPEDKKPSKEEDVIEVTPEVAEAIASKVVAGLDIDKKIETASKAAAEAAIAAYQEATEKAIEKKVGAAKNINIVADSSERKEVKFIKALVNLKKGNLAAVKEYNDSVMPDRAKAGYGNTTVDADGGYVVPDPDFEAAVERLEPNYGIAFQAADVRQVQGDSVKTNRLGSNVTMYETAQAGVKTGTKLTIAQDTVALRKFAAIAPLTDELNEDSAVDFYNELIIGFAAERARIADTLVFIENGTVYKGILRTSGVFVEPIASVAGITWDDLLNAESKIPTSAEANAKWYMHKTLWNVIKQVKDSEGRYQALPTGAKQTPWGTDVVLADIMPNSSSVDSDGSTPLAFYGDVKRTKLYVKKGLVIDILREGTVHGSDGAAINLGEQDMTAVRAVTRMVSLVKFPNAYTVLGTGNVS